MGSITWRHLLGKGFPLLRTVIPVPATLLGHARPSPAEARPLGRDRCEGPADADRAAAVARPGCRGAFRNAAKGAAGQALIPSSQWMMLRRKRWRRDVLSTSGG